MEKYEPKKKNEKVLFALFKGPVNGSSKVAQTTDVSKELDTMLLLLIFFFFFLGARLNLYRHLKLKVNMIAVCLNSV